MGMLSWVSPPSGLGVVKRDQNATPTARQKIVLTAQVLDNDGTPASAGNPVTWSIPSLAPGDGHVQFYDASNNAPLTNLSDKAAVTTTTDKNGVARVGVCSTGIIIMPLEVSSGDPGQISAQAMLVFYDEDPNVNSLPAPDFIQPIPIIIPEDIAKGPMDDTHTVKVNFPQHRNITYPNNYAARCGALNTSQQYLYCAYILNDKLISVDLVAGRSVSMGYIPYCNMNTGENTSNTLFYLFTETNGQQSYPLDFQAYGEAYQMPNPAILTDTALPSPVLTTKQTQVLTTASLVNGYLPFHIPFERNPGIVDLNDRVQIQLFTDGWTEAPNQAVHNMGVPFKVHTITQNDLDKGMDISIPQAYLTECCALRSDSQISYATLYFTYVVNEIRSPAYYRSMADFTGILL